MAESDLKRTDNPEVSDKISLAPPSSTHGAIDLTNGYVDTVHVDDSIVIIPDRPRRPRSEAPRHYRDTPPTTRVARSLSLGIIVAALVAFGVAMRVWILRSSFNQVDANEAVVGLMARAFSHGDLAAFTWGQDYGGTIEAMITSVFFTIFGVNTTLLKLVPVLLYAFSAVVVWRIGRRTVGKTAAALGASLFWASPFAFVLLSTKARGYYEITLLASLLSLLAVLHFAKKPRLLTAIAAGALAGIAVWSSPQALFLLLPTVVALAFYRPRAIYAIPFAAAFIVSGFPMLAQNIRSDWASLDMATEPTKLGFTDRLSAFFTDMLPMTMGVKTPFSGAWTISIAGAALCIVALYALIRGAVALRERNSELQIGFPVLATAAFPFLFALAPIAAKSVDNHHALLLWPSLALLIAFALQRLRITVAVVAAALCALAMVTLSSWDDGATKTDLVAPKINNLVQALKAKNIAAAYATDDLAYRITFESDRTIATTPVRDTKNNGIATQASNQPNTVFVTMENTKADETLSQNLNAQGKLYQRGVVDQFVIYELPQTLTRSQLRVQAGL